MKAFPQTENDFNCSMNVNRLRMTLPEEGFVKIIIRKFRKRLKNPLRLISICFLINTKLKILHARTAI